MRPGALENAVPTSLPLETLIAVMMSDRGRSGWIAIS